MLALVTGSNGFVGSHLIRHLLRQGWDVRAMVRKSSNLRLLEGVNPIFVHGDVTDPDAVARAVDGVDVVFHVAGIIAARGQEEFDRVNVGGTKNVVEACARASIPPQRVILISSIAAAGPSKPPRPRQETDEPNPVSQYGRSKVRAEATMSALPEHVDSVIVRPPIVYGSGDTATLDFYKSAKLGVLANITGKDRRYSFVHAKDLVRGLALAATREEARGQIYYLCGPQDGTLLEFQQAIARVMERRTVALPIPARLVRVAGGAADMWQRVRRKPAVFSRDKALDATQAAWVMNKDKAREELNFSGEIDFEQGVREAYEWYRLHGWL